MIKSPCRDERWGLLRVPSYEALDHLRSRTIAMRNLLLLLITTVVLSACGNSTPSERWDQAEAATVSAPDVGASHGAGRSAPLLEQRKIILNGSQRYEVDDLDAARKLILAQVQAHGGHVEGDDRSERGSSIDLSIRVRIPADRFDAFLGTLHPLSELLDQQISATDVTAQWVDVEARLAAKRKVEERYLAIVEQASAVTEILEVERELGNVRAEIESMEAQLNALKDQVSMSTLTITCTKPQAHSEQGSPRFGLAIKRGWHLFVGFLVGIVHLWPFLLIAGGILLWLTKRRSARKN